MSSILVLMVHDRLDLLKGCIQSMFSNTKFQFSEILICNDGSNRGTTKYLFDYVYNATGIKDVNLMHFSRNQGQGHILEFILNYATYKNPKYLFLLEQDYVWRKDWAEEAVAVLENSPHTIMVPATSHAGYYEEKSKEILWPNFAKEKFGSDLCPRDLMFKPFGLDIVNHEELQIRDKISVQGVSNSTTCNVIHWKRFHELRLDSNKVFNDEERFWIDVVRRACGIGLDTRVIVDDGMLSQGICYFWYKAYADKINKEKDFPILDICDFSIGNHLDGGGYHSKTSIIGVSTENSPKWEKDPPIIKKYKKPKAFVLRAPYSTSSGYETLITTITDELIKEDYDFYLEPVGPTKDKHLEKYKKYFKKTLPPEKLDCPELFICPMQVTDEGLRSWGYVPEKKRTLMTMWEASEINSQTAAEMSKMDKIIVPNHWNKRAIEKLVTQVPVHVVPLFADTEIFKYKEKKQSKVFVFGAGNSDPRKQLDKLISAFLKAFPSAQYSVDGKRVLVEGKLEKNEGVALVLKGSAGDEKRRFTDNRIKYITEKLSIEEMGDWYASLDCFVSIASAEGWGLMQHEAMACGTAVIAPLYAGLTEFMNQENCYPIKYKEVLADVSPWDITAGGLWSKYDEDHLIESMRHCYHNREQVHKRGKLAAEQVKKLTIKNTVNKIKEAMEIE
jgi:glycosyltransferase involved in cell wall biosynthesis